MSGREVKNVDLLLMVAHRYKPNVAGGKSIMTNNALFQGGDLIMLICVRIAS